MYQTLHQAFGLELAAQRRAEFELAARHRSLLRQLRRSRRRTDRAEPAVPRARTSSSAGQPARACCAGDLG